MQDTTGSGEAASKKLIQLIQEIYFITIIFLINAIIIFINSVLKPSSSSSISYICQHIISYHIIDFFTIVEEKNDCDEG